MKMTLQDYERERDNYCKDLYFKEYRVAVVITPNVERTTENARTQHS